MELTKFFNDHGISDQLTTNQLHVPGAFELPVVIARNIDSFDAFIALGCIIKGKTPHFELLSNVVTNAIMDLSIQNKKPIGNGIITCLNKKQALERAHTHKTNKGERSSDSSTISFKNFKRKLCTIMKYLKILE